MLFEINNKKIILFFLCGGEREREREREREKERDNTTLFFFTYVLIFSKNTPWGFNILIIPN